MKILHIINFFYPAWAKGGPPRSVYELSKELVKRGHEVTVYTTDIYKKKERMQNNKNPVILDGIKVYYFKNINYRLAWSNYSFSIDLIRAVKNNLSNFDIIHTHTFRGMHGALLHHYAQRKKISYLLQPRGCAQRLVKSQIKYLFDLVFGNKMIKDARKIIVSSDVESSQYYKYFPFVKKESFYSIPNGIDLSIYDKLPPHGEFKNNYNIKSNEKVILCLGRLHKTKGVDVLMKAFSLLLTDFSEIKLVIVGPDEGHLDILIKLSEVLKIKNNVIFTGPLYEKQKLEAYINTDIFVLPSPSESFGNVAMEACACGVPTLVTTGCGVKEWLNTIFITKPTSLGIYESLKKLLLLSNKERERIGIKTQKEVKKLSIKNITKETEKMYDILKK
jgi:glycosyltransferase involved in cell wall biosynthesis